ncbi:abhydrolase domain-containing protein [Vespula maculifrons]|uniref:palmitoyl-protein hydrolase n=1 Tax=Vespula maculifrons TaxID=7453 RepID=A0ABD2D3K8_VESMC
MNNFNFSELCCLFCCPPCPSRIAAKLAFLPPEPTYTFIEDEGSSKFTISLSERAEWQYNERELESVEGFYARTSRGNRIACVFVRCSATARFTLLFSHGNAVDLGQMSSVYLGLGSRINCNIFSYDYSGYGLSNGKPSEKNLYADIDAAWHALRTRYGISPENIILYGQSIGTVPTVDLATRYEVGAVVLHSPLMSGMRVAFRSTKRTWFFDAFANIDKVPKVTSPVLVIHGTSDDVIDFSHGQAIYERCPRAVEPLWIDGAGHNDVELYNQYYERLKQFVSIELSPPTGEKAPVLPCDKESSFASVDDVVLARKLPFASLADSQEIYFKQISKKNRSKNGDPCLDGRTKKPNVEADLKNPMQKSYSTTTVEKEQGKAELESANSCHDVRTNNTGLSTKKLASLSKYYKYVDGKLKPIPSFSNASAGAKKGSTDLKDTHSNVKSDKKNPLSQFYYNGVESAFGSHCPPKNCKQRLRTSIVEGITKGKKIDEKEDRNRSAKYREPAAKKFLWSGNFHPLRNLGARTSLTVEPDKITITPSKYSPCASRLAASSKILSNDLGANSDSPLHVARSRSPSRVDVQTTDNNTSKNVERTSMQASLSLNIQQFIKTRCAPRSKSVDDSCVTSLTSEATTLSYSPTSTEVLSLGEVGQQTSSAEGSASYSEVKEKLVTECSDKVQRASLETKC